MPKINIASIKLESATGYPEPFRQAVLGRSRRRLGNAVGLDQFGVNLTRLKPNAQSSQRHWHAAEDEFVPEIDRVGHLYLRVRVRNAATRSGRVVSSDARGAEAPRQPKAGSAFGSSRPTNRAASPSPCRAAP